jgi:hypothetical protein
MPEPIPLLVPCVPAPHELLPWLERMHAARHYSNFDHWCASWKRHSQRNFKSRARRSPQSPMPP